MIFPIVSLQIKKSISRKQQVLQQLEILMYAYRNVMADVVN